MNNHNTFWGTVGKIALVALIIWIALELFPVLFVPIFGLCVIGLIVGSVLLGLGTALAAVVLSLLLAALLGLAPLALPVLAVIGLIHLCRRNPAKSATVPPSAA